MLCAIDNATVRVDSRAGIAARRGATRRRRRIGDLSYSAILGRVPGLISTVIFAIPAPIRLTHLGISSVPNDLREVAEAFGATRRQLLFKVELPHALPTIMAGVTQCIMLSLSMVVIAALVGADGLGKPVVRALNSVNIAMGFEAGLAIVILAIILDRVFKRSGRHKDDTVPR
jgi:glycine betaine/proline transport system permease protein